MKALWTRLSDRYAALQARERIVIFAGAVAAVALLGYRVLVDPHMVAVAVAGNSLAQVQQSRVELQSRLAATEAQGRVPDAQVRADLETATKRLAQLDTQFAKVQATLVPPAQMANLVESLLKASPGLQLVSLTTLPPTPVSAKPPAAFAGDNKTSPAAADKAPPAAAQANDGATLYRHGQRIVVRGGYADLLAYLERLERLPQKMYWGEVVLSAEEHPVSRMQFTVYTISFGKSWLEI